MTTGVHQLVVSLVDDLFGPICAKTVSTILKNSQIGMKEIIERTGFDKRTANQCLCVLIKHRFVRFDEIAEKKRAVRYTVDILQSLSLPFYPMFVNIVKQQHGDMAEVVLEELLHQGSSFKDSLLDICLIRLQTSVKDKHTVTMETLDSIFEVLRSRGYVEKTEEPSEDGEPPTKKSRSSGGVMWRVNTQAFYTFMRDTQIVEFIKNRFDEGAGEVVSVILLLNNQIDGDMSQCSSSASYDQILHALKNKSPTMVPFAKSYLDILTDSDLGIVKLVDDFGGGSFLINFSNFYLEYAKHHICSIVRERFGPKSHRIFSIVMAKKMIEQKQVAELALIPYKDAKELLYTLYTENFLEIQELHRTPDFSPLRTFYLFHVPLEKLSSKLLNVCYKAIYNLMSLRKDNLNENSRLVDKSLRADASTLAATQQGIAPEDLEDMLTSSEKQQLGSCMRVVKRLDLGEINILDSISALTHFGNNQNVH